MYQMMYEDLARAYRAEQQDVNRRHGIQRSSLRIGMEVRRMQHRQNRR